MLVFVGCATKKYKSQADVKQEIIKAEILRSKAKKSTKKVYYNLDVEKIGKIYGYRAKLRALDLDTLINSLYESDEVEKIVKINDYFNLFRFISDMRVWGESDYWATREEFIGMGAGDCEDYVISKYFTLKQLGISIDKLYLTYVKALALNQAHMVLTYYKTPDSIPLVLDNINKNILPSTQRNDLLPIYSFNGKAMFISKKTGLQKMVPMKNKNHIKWKNLTNRINKGKK